MARYDQYNPDYRKIYPGIEKRPDVLDVLRSGDRKRKYIEVDLKSERFIQDQRTQTAVFVPSREDSYERLLEDENQQFPHPALSPEETLLRNIEYGRLYQAIAALTKEERRLIVLRYWHGLTQAQVAEEFHISQQSVSYRESRILQKIKKLMEN